MVVWWLNHQSHQWHQLSQLGSLCVIFWLTLMWPSSKKPCSFTQSTTWLCLTQESTGTRWARAVIDQPVMKQTHIHIRSVYACWKKKCREQSVCKCKCMRKIDRVQFAPVFPPQSLLLAKGSSLTVCVVRGLAYTTHLFPVPAWQVLATGQPLKWLWGGVGVLLTGIEPTPPGITLDMSSEVSASHRLMEAVGQQADVWAKGKERTAVYSPVISTLILIRKTDFDTIALWNNAVNK